MDPKNLSYYADLVHMRSFLEDYYGSNVLGNRCQETTRFVAKILGLEEVAGNYTGPSVGNFYKNAGHLWNYDPENDVFVDLTLNQFDSSNNEISVLPIDTDRLQAHPYKIELLHRGVPAYDVDVNDLVDSYKASLVK